jgi:hypothetical protein
MDHTRRANTSSPSTTYHWEDGSLRRAGAPEGTARPTGRSIWSLRWRDPRKPLDLQIQWIGGAEDTWLIRARGWRWKVTGEVELACVLRWINRCD